MVRLPNWTTSGPLASPGVGKVVVESVAVGSVMGNAVGRSGWVGYIAGVWFGMQAESKRLARAT